jgi:hypothetical protein
MNVLKRLPGNGKESGKPLDKARRQPSAQTIVGWRSAPTRMAKH